MPNTIATPTWTARKLLVVASNKARFVSAITKKLSDDFVVEGTKVGATVNLRLPPRYITNKGQAIQIQPITQVLVPVTITDQAQIAWSYSSFTATLELQDVEENCVNPAGIQLANTYDADGLSRVYQDVFSAEGTPGTVPNANSTYLNAAARLTNFAAPSGPRKAVINALMRASIANANLASFNPQKQISNLFTEGMFSGPALSWDEWYEDVNVFPHTVGPLGGTPTVNGSGQTGSSLITQAWTAAAASRLKKGDVFTIGAGATGVFAVNPQNYRSTTQLQQFVVTQDVSSDGAGAATIPIYPPIVTSGAYQTVDVSPASGATINVLGAASTVTPQGLGFHPSAFVMASANLIKPTTGESRNVRMKDIGLSVRYWLFSDGMTDQHPARLDGIYGFKTVRPEFAVRFAS
jgi:P22 coat protein - gene protein 5